MDTSDDSTKLAPESEEQKSATDILKKNSLKAAGLAYLVGDAAIVASGIATGNKARRNTGLFWGAGGVAPAFFGNPSTEKQLEIITSHLADYLHKQGVEIPDNPDVASLNKRNGVVDHVKNFFYEHPSEALNVIYALGSTQMVMSGLKNGLKGASKTDHMDIASGLLVGAGALSGLLIREKKPDPESPPTGTLGKIKQWAQEKPLRVSGAFYHANNAAMLVGGVNAMREQKANMRKGLPHNTDYRLRFLTAGTYIFANIMLMMSSKNHHDGAHSIEPTMQMADLSAKVIAAQPKEVQEALVQNVAGYLSSQPEIDHTAQEISTILHKKLTQIKGLSGEKPTWQERTQGVMSPSNSPQIT